MISRDAFGDDRPPGAVLGSAAPEGAPRLGSDAERGMAIDHGALRIAHLERAGWGRAGIVYGPVEARAGTAVCALVLNGHNASDADEIARDRRRAALPRWRRVLDRRRQPALEGNLAVGWFADHDTPLPLGGALALVVRGAEGENGELCAVLEGRLAPLQTGLRNVPVLYVAVLREQGAAYFAGSLPGTPGLAAAPWLRPLAITSRGGPQRFAGLHQSVLGQAGYKVDTRVYGIAVDALPELLGGEDLRGEGALPGAWEQGAAGWTRTAEGARPGAAPALRAFEAPSGLLHAELDGAGAGGIAWRGGAWSVLTGGDGTALLLGEEVIAHDAALRRSGPRALQVRDDGAAIDVHVDGRRAFGGPVADARHAGRTAAGIRGEGDLRVRRFEAQPAQVLLPARAVPSSGPAVPAAGAELAGDGFGGSAGPLDGRTPDRGARGPWARRLGEGAIAAGGGSARVDADRGRPFPGPGFHLLPWAGGLADLAIEQTPPGERRGDGHRGRAGLVFRGAADDHLVVNTWLDDAYEGTAVSAFLRLGGREDHFRSVWCNVGRLIAWGRRSRLRVAFDGHRWTVWVGDEPVLQRAITDLHPSAAAFEVREVGIAVNEEYGDDTGTVIHDFTARGER